MTTLQRVMSEVAALRDGLDIRTLNNLALVCRDLNDSTRLSDAYRREYHAQFESAMRILARPRRSPALEAPAADFKKVLRGEHVTSMRSCGMAGKVTRADRDAQLYYNQICYPQGLESARRLIERVEPEANPAPTAAELAQAAARRSRMKKQCVVLAAVFVGMAVALGLLLQGATLAGAIAVMAVCELSRRFALPLFP